MKKVNQFWIAILVLAMASLACNFGRGIKTPEPTIPVSTEAVEDLEQSLQDAYQQAQQGGQITITIDESQITSLLTFELQEGGGEDYIKNPQVYLRDGKIKLVGSVATEQLSAPAEVLLSVQIDSAGRPYFKVESAKVGPLPLPEQFVSEIEAKFNEAMAAQLASAAPDAIIESIDIADGVMTITGRMK